MWVFTVDTQTASRLLTSLSHFPGGTFEFEVGPLSSSQIYLTTEISVALCYLEQCVEPMDNAQLCPLCGLPVLYNKTHHTINQGLL